MKGKGIMKKTIISLVAGIISILAVHGLTNPASAWGPENRPTYTNDSPASYATFNSITNNAAVGDERNFVRVGEVGSDAPYTDEIEIVPGKEYEVYIYYHNNAASNTNSTGYGMATNTRISSGYPFKLNPGDRGMVSGIISWSYVNPADDKVYEGSVWDEAYLTTKYNDVKLRYKTGSAIIHNGGKANGSVLASSLFTDDGALIGYNKMGGTIPGCAEYSGYITYTLIAEKTDAAIEKHVSLDGENWSKSVNAKPGDIVTYKVVFNNNGNTTMTNVIFKDTHDAGLNLYSGSTTVYDNANVDGKKIDDIIDLSGYNVGDITAGSMVQIIYQMRIGTDTAFCGKTLQNVIEAKFNSDGSIQDSTTVTVSCDETPPDDICITNPDAEDCKTPTPTPTPDNPPSPDTPQEIINTGPVEIVLAVVVVLSISFGGFYLYRTSHKLHQVKKTVSGEEPKTEVKDQPKEPTQPEQPQDEQK